MGISSTLRTCEHLCSHAQTLEGPNALRRYRGKPKSPCPTDLREDAFARYLVRYPTSFGHRPSRIDTLHRHIHQEPCGSTQSKTHRLSITSHPDSRKMDTDTYEN